MAGSFMTLAVLDGGGTSRNMRVWDESGSGTGPFSFAPVTTGFGETFTDRSGTISSGGTSQQLMAINNNRRRFIVMNPTSPTGQGISISESLYINFTSAAGVDNGTSIEITPGGWYDSGIGIVTPEKITINAATTGHVFVAKEM
jgi:hypothetical protein